MHDLLSGLFSYPFIQRALIAGTLVALCSALLGVSLVLKRYSMIGDGLSHVGFGAMAVAMALGAAPLAVALPVVILAAFSCCVSAAAAVWPGIAPLRWFPAERWPLAWWLPPSAAAAMWM